jgi:hypothetical protein
MLRVQRLQARARLDDPAPALARAAAEAESGDESWAEWIAEYERGEAVIIRLDVSLEVSDGAEERIEVENRGVWIEKDHHPAKIEQQVAELASKDYATLVGRLSERGHELDRRELGEMYVHVELADDLRAALSDPDRARRDRRIGAPKVDIRTSKQHEPE